MKKRRSFLKVLAASAILGTFALASCEVNVEVKDPTSQVESIVITVPGDVKSIKVGETLQLTADSSVTWSSSDDKVVTVSDAGLVTAVAEGNVKITATSTINTSITKSVALIIKAGDTTDNGGGSSNNGGSNGEGVTITQDWDSINYATHDQYISAVDDTPLKIKGKITYISSSKSSYIYCIQNGNDAYYIYQQSLALGEIEVGKVYEVCGFKTNYGANCLELKNVEVCKELTEDITVTANNLANVDLSDEDNIYKYQASYVSGNAVIESITINESKAYSFKAKINDVSFTFEVKKNDDDDFASINQKLKEARSFDFKGYIITGRSSSSIYLLSSDDLTIQAMTDADKVELAANRVSVVPSILASVNSITLPTKSDYYETVSISWASSSASIDVATGVVTHSGEETVTLTATFTLNGETTTRTYSVYIFEQDTKQYEEIAKLDFEGCETPNQYGVSGTKSSYADGNVTLGGHTWLLAQTLIASDGITKEGDFAGRVKHTGGDDVDPRIQIEEYLEINAIDFKAVAYNSGSVGATLHVEYQLEGSSEWTKVSISVAVTDDLLEYHFALPEGAKKVAIVLEQSQSGAVTINVDSIKLLK